MNKETMKAYIAYGDQLQAEAAVIKQIKKILDLVKPRG